MSLRRDRGKLYTSSDQDLSDKGLKLVDFTVSYIKYDQEHALVSSRRLINEGMDGGTFERETFEKYRKEMEDALKAAKLPSLKKMT